MRRVQLELLVLRARLEPQVPLGLLELQARRVLQVLQVLRARRVQPRQARQE